MKIGTYYYPEQWPRAQWERDFDNIVKMGLQIVHMGEFAWFTMEPRAGEFRFDWLSECVEMAAARGLDVILCTPTAAPPVWLIEAHPEVLPKIAEGPGSRFGGRRHYSPTAPAMKEASARIVTALAERFGDHPAVIGWHIDNEYSGAFDQNDHAHAAFQQWLRGKYGTIEELNRAWGCQFWNTYYTDWSQIRFPAGREPHYRNPHHHLDASRFWSSAFASFNKLQTDILKPRIGKRFITTNFMPLHPDVNPDDMSGDLSLFSWDSYPITGWDRNVTNEEFRIADPAGIGLVHDQMASYTGRWGLLEIQPGQVNWSGVPVLLYPGAVRLWLWTAYAHGAEFITTYRFRQPLFGIELFHHGLVGTDGVTPSAGGKQFAQVIDEVKRLEPAAEAKQPEIGLLLDFDQLWYFNTLPQSNRWDQPGWLRAWYAAFARLGLKVRILHPNRPWPDDLPVIVAPGVQMVDDALVARWNDYARAGGHLVLTCRTGLMDRTGQLWEGPAAKPILPLIGARIEAYDGLPADHWGHIELDGTRHRWGAWGDLLKPTEAMVLARYADQFYKGTPAVTQNTVGKGVVTYCGVYAEDSLVDALAKKIAQQAGLKTIDLPRRVQVLSRDGYRICLNYLDQPYEAPAPKNAEFIVGQRTIEPAGVAVWRG